MAMHAYYYLIESQCFKQWALKLFCVFDRKYSTCINGKENMVQWIKYKHLMMTIINFISYHGSFNHFLSEFHVLVL